MNSWGKELTTKVLNHVPFLLDTVPAVEDLQAIARRLDFKPGPLIFEGKRCQVVAARVNRELVVVGFMGRLALPKVVRFADVASSSEWQSVREVNSIEEKSGGVRRQRMTNLEHIEGILRTTLKLVELLERHGWF